MTLEVGPGGILEIGVWLGWRSSLPAVRRSGKPQLHRKDSSQYSRSHMHPGVTAPLNSRFQHGSTRYSLKKAKIFVALQWPSG